MTKHLESANSVSSNDTLENCSALPGIFQIAVGVLLATASAFVYGLMHHPALLIPAIMGTALLFSGARALMVCRESSAFHQHPSNGITR
jgi:hypothetical protein